METISKTKIVKDVNNKRLRITREFNAPLEKVWDAWTKSEILDQWWAPNPWKTRTHSMDFREGGTWLYAMLGPEGEVQNCRVDYKKIVPQKSFEGTDAFSDENWDLNRSFPVMLWKCEFSKAGAGTRVDVDVIFDSESDLNKIVEMGFEEGFTAAHSNLDEVLKRL